MKKLIAMACVSTLLIVGTSSAQSESEVQLELERCVALVDADFKDPEAFSCFINILRDMDPGNSVALAQLEILAGKYTDAIASQEIAVKQAEARNRDTELTFSPRVSLGLSDFSRTIIAPAGQLRTGTRLDLTEAPKPQIEAGGTLTMAGLGLTIETGAGYFADLYYQKSVDGSFPLENDDLNSNNGCFLSAAECRTDFIGDSGDIEKEDFAISFGKTLNHGFALAAGYKSGESEFRSVGFTQDQQAGSLESTFELKGPFVSVSWGKPIYTGFLGLNIAVAQLDGVNEFLDTNLIDAPGRLPPLESFGEATAVTYGVSWKAPIFEDWFYSISANYYDYDYEVQSFINRNGMSISSGVAGSTIEELTSISLSLGYTFD